LRAVLDTNVLISALIKAGKPRRLLRAMLNPGHAVIISEPIVEELSRVSADEKVSVLNNPDDKVLAVAKDGEADYIVTGDRHLLELSTFGRIKIITVDEALRIARGKK
jgi:predicted nucleic acid-binding protein